MSPPCDYYNFSGLVKIFLGLDLLVCLHAANNRAISILHCTLHMFDLLEPQWQEDRKKKRGGLRGQNGHLAGVLLPPWGGISSLGDGSVSKCFATRFLKSRASKSKEWTHFISGGVN